MNNPNTLTEHPILILARRYPQLSLPIKPGERETEEYKSAVLRGKKIENRPAFLFNENDRLMCIDTPAGKAEVLFLEDREDFVHAMRALAHRCEPVEIPESNGATAISGLINWEKLRPHLETDFDEFISDKNNYLDKLIILSSGFYSALKPEAAGFNADEWREKSIIIRQYHELTHFVSGKLYPDNKEAIRDEVIADSIGVIAATGELDALLIKKFLGTEGEVYREGGRLQNYCDDPAEKMPYVNSLAEKLAEEYNFFKGKSPFDFLEYIEEKKIGMN